jgi:hypothetical protein
MENQPARTALLYSKAIKTSGSAPLKTGKRIKLQPGDPRKTMTGFEPAGG